MMSDENTKPEDSEPELVSEPKLVSEADAAKAEPTDEPVAAPRTGDPVADGDTAPPSDALTDPPVEAEQAEAAPVEPAQPDTVEAESVQPEAAPVEPAQPDPVFAETAQPADAPVEAEQPEAVTAEPEQPVDAPVDSEQPDTVDAESVQPEPAPVDSEQPEAVVAEPSPVSDEVLAQILESVPQPEWVGLDPDAERPFDPEKWPADLGEPAPYIPDEPRRPELLQAVEAGTGVAVMNDVLVGRIPSNYPSIDRTWQYTLNGLAVDTPTNARLNVGHIAGILMPVFGKIVGLTVNVSNNLTGTIDLSVYNITTTSGTDSPAFSGLAENGKGTVWADGLAVSFGDEVALRFEISDANTGTLNIPTSFIIKEQTAYIVTGTLVPDATGVYVRNGQQAGKPAFERIDGAYWLTWADPAWNIDATNPPAFLDLWLRENLNLVGDYAGQGAYTGTATVAAHPD